MFEIKYYEVVFGRPGCANKLTGMFVRFKNYFEVLFSVTYTFCSENSYRQLNNAWYFS